MSSRSDAKEVVGTWLEAGDILKSLDGVNTVDLITALVGDHLTTNSPNPLCRSLFPTPTAPPPPPPPPPPAPPPAAPAPAAAPAMGEGSCGNRAMEESKLREAERVHTVFVLLDGLGSHVLRSFCTALELEREAPAEGSSRSTPRSGSSCLLAQRCLGSIRSVFPATTAAALSSIGSGLHPSQHSMLGWEVVVKFKREKSNIEFKTAAAAATAPATTTLGSDEDGRIAFNPLPYRAPRVENSPELLRSLCSDEDMYPFESQFNSLCRSSEKKIKVRWFAPYQDTPFSRRMHGDFVSEEKACNDASDYSLTQASQGLKNFWDESSASGANSFSYVYSAQPDKYLHKYGLYSSQVFQELKARNQEIEEIWENAKKHVLRSGGKERIRLIVTADHGHVNGHHVSIDFNDVPFKDLLKYAPSVEMRSPCFHLKDNSAAGKIEFAKAFQNTDLAKFWVLLSIEEIQELELMGPKPLAEEAKARLGDFMCISKHCNGNSDTGPVLDVKNLREKKKIGNHGGATPFEMLVPLIIMDTRMVEHSNSIACKAPFDGFLKEVFPPGSKMLRDLRNIDTK